MTQNDGDTLGGVLGFGRFLTFLQVVMQIFIRPNERARKMLRIHHLNLFHIRRSLHLFFRSPSHWAILTIRIDSIAQCGGDLKNRCKDRRI